MTPARAYAPAMRRTVLAAMVAIAMSSSAIPSALGAADLDAAPTPSASVAPVPAAEETEPTAPPTPEPPETTPTPPPTTAPPTTAPPTTPPPTTQPPRPKPKPKYVKKTITIGTSPKGRPIRATFKGYENASHVVVVLGQMHGDEPAGPRVVKRMISSVPVGKGKGVWFVPTMNPDGAARGTRTNARGVDLNRNWPTSGFSSRGKGTRTWGGPRAQSERETRAMLRFLKAKKPDYVASLHQPYGVIARTGIDKKWEKRLSKELAMPIETVSVGTPSTKVSPTLTGWYNRFYRRHGTATTIEFRASVSSAYVKKRAAPGILRAAKAL